MESQQIKAEAVMDGSADAWDTVAKGYEQIGSARSSTGLKSVGLKAGSPETLRHRARCMQHQATIGMVFQVLLQHHLLVRTGDLAIVAAREFKAQVMDGQNLELEDSSFDVVHSSFGVTLFSDFRKGLEEMVNVTKQGGRVVVVGRKAGSGTYAPWFKVICGGNFSDADPAPKSAAAKFMGAEEGISNKLTAAGAEHKEVSEERNEVRVTDVAALVDESLNNPFMQEVHKRLKPGRWEELQQALHDMLADSKLNDGATAYYITSLIACGRKPVH